MVVVIETSPKNKKKTPTPTLTDLTDGGWKNPQGGTSTSSSGGGHFVPEPMEEYGPVGPVPTPLRNPPDTNAKVHWNPPAHALTKPPRISWGVPWDMSKETTHQTSMGVVNSTQQTKISSGRLGAIYNEGSEEDRHGARWGVNFHYNPTSVVVGASSLEDDELTVQGLEQDIAKMNPLGFMGSLTVELYFNRIYDIAHPGAGNYYPALGVGSNPAGENQEELIKRLGTNYDIEYLYRVANGDPVENRLLDYKSADLGILMWRPSVFHLGPFRYRGVISHISVNHIIFTPDMIPTFSSVSIGFNRFPGDITLGTTDNSAPSVEDFAGVSTNTGSAPSGFNGGGGDHTSGGGGEYGSW